MTRTRSRREEPPLPRDARVVRGVLGGVGLDPAELHASAALNGDLYGFYGISVWVASAEFPVAELERTKLVKFDRYAEFAVSDLLSRNLELWATGQRPHYDVVYTVQEDVDALVKLLAETPHRIRLNSHVDREEH